VRTAQRRAAARWHPDRCRDPAERSEAQRRVTEANEAAAVLLDPLHRGRALLEALAPSPKPSEPRPEAEFLADMLALHEGLVSADSAARHAAMEEVTAMRRASEREALRHFARLSAGDASAWVDAASALARLRAAVRAAEGWSP